MKAILFSLACLLAVSSVNAQLKFGVRSNVFTSTNSEQSITLQNLAPLEIIDFKYQNSNTGYSAGGFVYGSNKLLFFMTELLYQSNTSNFNLSSDENNLQRARSSRDFSVQKKSIYIPVAAGLKFGNFKVGLGPTFNFALSQSDNIGDLEAFQIKKDPYETGFQFLVGYSLFDRIHLDLKREMSFSKATDGITYHDQSIGMNNSVSKVSLSLGVLF
jgi:hypothetical protein